MKQNEPVADNQQKIVLYLGVAIFLSLLFSVVLLAVIQLSRKSMTSNSWTGTLYQESTESSKPAPKVSPLEKELIEIEEEINNIEQEQIDLTPPTFGE